MLDMFLEHHVLSTEPEFVSWPVYEGFVVDIPELRRVP
jgi:hypothetical protein